MPLLEPAEEKGTLRKQVRERTQRASPGHFFGGIFVEVPLAMLCSEADAISLAAVCVLQIVSGR